MQKKYRSGPSRRSFLKSVAAVSLGGVVTSVYGTGRQLLPVPVPGGAEGIFSGRPGTEGEFVPVMLTPFRADLSVDTDALDQLIDFYQRAGARGMFAVCASSEMYELTPPERLAVARQVVERAGDKMPVVATGSFGDTMEEKAEFTKRMSGTGVRAVILITSHFAGREEEDSVLIRNLERLTAMTGDLPLGTYECPSPYKRLLTPEVFSFLLKTGRFVYHKDTSEDIRQITAKLRLSEGSRLRLYNAHTASALASLRAGAAGLSPISGNFYPEVLSWLCRNARNPERQADAEWIQSELALAERVISRGYPRSAKYFLGKRGLSIGLHCRVRRRELTGEDKAALEGIHERFLGWCDRLGIQPVS